MIMMCDLLRLLKVHLVEELMISEYTKWFKISTSKIMNLDLSFEKSAHFAPRHDGHKRFARNEGRMQTVRNR